MGFDLNYGKYMDHTILKPYTTKEMLKRFCDEAKQYHFASVAVNPSNIPYVVEQLKGSDVKACAAIGFPLGATTTLVKVTEAKEAIENGAGEVDFVINIGRLKDKDYDYVSNEIKQMVEIAHPNALCKVILENCYLTDEEKVIVCKMAVEAKADFVKTSTGMGSGGATVEDVKLMKQTVGDAVQVKAATGINNREICDQMLAAGATRMGTSKGIYIVKDELPNL